MNKLEAFVPAGQEPDQKFYRDAACKGIFFEEAARAVRKAQIPAYRAQITAYLVGRCASEFEQTFRLDRIWAEQGISEELFDLMLAWAADIQKCIVDSAKGQNVTEWCKKEACWEEVGTVKLSAKPTPPEALPIDKDPLFSVTPTTSAKSSPILMPQESVTPALISSESLDDIELCLRLNERAWAQIALWGEQTRSLSDFERKIVATMQQMSVGGWARNPSVKQAKHAGRIARQAIDREVVSTA
jgi:hypothetical protein